MQISKSILSSSSWCLSNASSMYCHVILISNTHQKKYLASIAILWRKHHKFIEVLHHSWFLVQVFGKSLQNHFLSRVFLKNISQKKEKLTAPCNPYCERVNRILLKRPNLFGWNIVETEGSNCPLLLQLEWLRAGLSTVVHITFESTW